MHKLLKSVLRTAEYLLEQSGRAAGDMRERVSDGVSDLRDRTQSLYARKDHTVRNVISFGAGLGLGIGVAILFAPTSGEETRNSIGEKIQDISEQVRKRFSREMGKSTTGTDGVSGFAEHVGTTGVQAEHRQESPKD